MYFDGKMQLQLLANIIKFLPFLCYFGAILSELSPLPSNLKINVS